MSGFNFILPLPSRRRTHAHFGIFASLRTTTTALDTPTGAYTPPALQTKRLSDMGKMSDGGKKSEEMEKRASNGAEKEGGSLFSDSESDAGSARWRMWMRRRP